jgi:hypothetical protein
MPFERLVVLIHAGRRFTFRVGHERGAPSDCPPRLSVWLVETEGHVYPSRLHVTGDEQPEFFRGLADAAIKRHGL